MTDLIEVDFRHKGDTDDIGMRVKRRKLKDCQHHKTIIDEVLRTVACRDCGEDLDPVEVMLYWAKDWERYAGAVGRLRNEQSMLKRDIEDLKRQLRNIKARVRRAL